MSSASIKTSFSFGNLQARDELGRKFPEANKLPRHRKDRYVGLFYFLWLGQHGTGGPFNITEIVTKTPEAKYDPEHPAWGGIGEYHFWGEPFYGYYYSEDPWVVRKHIQLLTIAGVDFLVFDATNGVVYKKVYDIVLQVAEEIRLQGWDVPKFVFYTNTRSGETVKKIYDDIYKNRRYEKLWFKRDDKPLIIGDPEDCSQELKDFFTFRLNQWPNEEQKVNGFPWVEFQRPQRVYYNEQNEKEVINVAVAQHPTVVLSDTPFYNQGLNWGRSFHDGENDQSKDAYKWGYNIEEQWDFALKEDPKMVHITGWNEWIAMRFKGPKERPVRFIDQATLDFSRDIEPCKDGYKDNYYLQMIANIRKYKGMDLQVKASKKKTIDINGEFSQWQDIKPEYKDFTQDTVNRNHAGYAQIYVNNSGRNDFETMKVARDDEYIYFYASTVEPISKYTDKNWMMLFINILGEENKNWEGYNFVVNRKVKDESTTVLETSTGGWNWEEISEVKYHLKDNELQIAIPKKALGLNLNQPLNFQFKWSDNMQNEGDIMDFYANGDVAPDGRLNFVYQE